MWQSLKQSLQRFDWVLFSSVLLLACFGLMEIYSIALGQGNQNFLNFKKQVLFIGLGVLLVFVFSLIDWRIFKSFYRYLYFLGAGLLGVVLVLGQAIRGTKGWFYIGGFGIQPVEFIKIILIVFLASFFSRVSAKVRPWKYFLLSGASSAFLIFLVLMQPDFGSALILFSIWLLMLIFVGFNRKYFVIIALVGIIAFAGSWFFFFKDYQKQRILTFLNPTRNSLKDGYNISQAIIAVGSGNLTGRGVGFGSQSQLKFLPEAQNDFIFAVISEELGFMGISLVFLFYAVLFFRCFLAVRQGNDDFAIFFILGVVGLIFIEMFINIGMNIGIMPVVGISLPFVSYGGSSILASFIMIGMIENIIIRSKA